MTWLMSNESREQACGRHLGEVLPRLGVAMQVPRVAELEIENNRLREKVRALMTVIDCVTSQLNAMEQQTKPS